MKSVRPAGVFKPFKILLAILWIMSIHPCPGGTPFFSTLSMRDGLPSNIISCVAQDRFNFIWVGTGSGLARYDGYNFVNFLKNDSPRSLPSNEITCLLPDGDYLWIGTWKGLCKINVVTFAITAVDLGEHNIIRALYKDRDGAVWIGTASGLIRYTQQSNQYSVFTGQDHGLSHNTIRTIYQDHDRNLWVGTYDKLNKLPRGAERFTVYDLKGNYKPSLKNNLVLDIKPFSENSDSLLWIGTETGLYSLRTAGGTITHYSESKAGLSNEVVKCVYTGKDGALWLGTDFGLNVFDPRTGKTSTHFHNPQLHYSIANNVIWQIFEDSGGVIWFITSNGLSRVNKYGSFYTYHEVSHKIKNQSIGNQVKSFLVSSGGIYWMATQHGVIRMDPAGHDKRIFDTNSPPASRLLLNNVYALEEDSLGRIWIGTAGGINVWDERRQKMYAITSSPANGLTSNYIGKFTKGTDGSFWVCAWEGGLFKVEGDFENIEAVTFRSFDDQGSEKNTSGAGAIWILKYDELYRLDLGSLKMEHIPSFAEAAGKRTLFNLYYSRANRLWAGTVNGLVEYNAETGEAVFHPVVIGSDFIIRAMMEDGEGNIWCSTNYGLLRFDTDSHHAVTFPLDENIPLKSFYYGCAAKGMHSHLIFGGDNGYISFSPEQIIQNTYKPPVYITALEINNKTIAAGETIDGRVILPSNISFTKDLVLPYKQRSLAFEFSSLHYWQPAFNIYAYKLAGLDDDWTYVSGNKNFAMYSNLASGDYTLMVKGTNNYGVWNDAVTTLGITVKPPLFLSKGFILAYVLILGGIVYYALRTYSARVHLRNELKITRMEKQHAEEIERTKEQFFTNISHELRTPISLILPPIHQLLKRGGLSEENERLIELAERNSKRLLRLVNQILDFNKLENDTLLLKVTPFDMVGFCHDIYLLFGDKARRNAIHFEFHASEEECQVWADAEKMETMLFNLLSNAFKFTPKEGGIEVSLRTLPGSTGFPKGAIELVVRDSGIGISPAEQSHIFDRFYQTSEGKKTDIGSGIGLTLAAEYVRLHHGTIHVQSGEGKGTSFVVHIPLGKDHFPAAVLHGLDETDLPAIHAVAAAGNGSGTGHIPDLTAGRPLVLIIEDNSDMVDLIRMSLQDKYNFIVAENGEEGVAKAGRFLPGVIVSDIMMPVMDGLTLCRHIKANPDTTHIAIILLTAKSLTAHKIEGIRSGADVYLTKPFEVELLDANIEHLLRRKEELADYFKKELLFTPPGDPGMENTDEQFVKRVMDIIEVNISNPEFGVDVLSEEMGLSATQLYRKLKSLTSLSANEIIKKYRIKKASMLLRNRESNITGVMYDVGFSSLSYFSKCFRAEFGMTPKKYQQKMIHDTEAVNEKPGGF